jgi:glycosyltransferase involved in cell wall biosynthesis
MRVLLIAKYFPPAGSARAVQAGRLASALAQAGAEVVVIAGRPEGSPAVPAMAGVEIHDLAYADGSDRHPRWRRLSRLARNVAETLWRSRWQRQAVDMANDLIARKRPNAVLSLSVPFDPHRVAAEIARRHRLPWVAYLSDPWPLGLLPAPYSDREFGLLTHLQARDARRVLANADAVVAPTRQMLDFLKGQSIITSDCRSEAIAHIGAAQATTAPTPVFLHAGLISHARSSAGAVEGLARLAERLHAEGGRLLQLGEVDAAFRRQFADLEASGAIQFLPPVSAKEALAWIARARALLILESDCAFSPFVPSKLADYAMARRPVLAITPPGSALRAMASDMPWLFLARHEPDDIVAAGLAAWNAPAIDARASNAFEPSSIAARFLAVLDTVTGQHDSSACKREAIA